MKECVVENIYNVKLLLNRSMLNYASLVFESEIISFTNNAGKKGNVTMIYFYNE